MEKDWRIFFLILFVVVETILFKWEYTLVSETCKNVEGVSAPSWIYVQSISPQKKSEERGHIQDTVEEGQGAAPEFSPVSVAALTCRCSSVCHRAGGEPPDQLATWSLTVDFQSGGWYSPYIFPCIFIHGMVEHHLETQFTSLAGGGFQISAQKRLTTTLNYYMGITNCYNL